MAWILVVQIAKLHCLVKFPMLKSPCSIPSRTYVDAVWCVFGSTFWVQTSGHHMNAICKHFHSVLYKHVNPSCADTLKISLIVRISTVFPSLEKIHRSPVYSPFTKEQWCEGFIFYLMLAWTKWWTEQTIQIRCQWFETAWHWCDVNAMCSVVCAPGKMQHNPHE